MSGDADYVFDWNEVERRGALIPKGFTVFDETLRDGLQNPSVVDPGIGEKIKILHLMESLGIHEADIGLPGSSKRAFDDVLRLCKEVVDCKMKIKIACAGRTVVGDITPMIEVSQRAGIPVEVYAFIGSSPIRQYVEDW
ncbi:MAG: 2-isopropylmalate synthase, partial [Polyangiaceae bacterium]